MLVGSRDPGVKYAGTFLGAIGIYPCIANTISWVANNVEGVYKRGATLGIVIGWGNLNGVVSSNIYRAKYIPDYLPGHGVVLAYLSVFLLGGSILTRYLLQVENRKRSSRASDNMAGDKTEKDMRLIGDQRYVGLFKRAKNAALELTCFKSRFQIYSGALRCGDLKRATAVEHGVILCGYLGEMLRTARS